MFSMKLIGGSNSNIASKTINNIVNFVLSRVNLESPKVIADSSSIEVVSGKEIYGSKDDVIVELLIKKTVIINIKDLDDKNSLDEHIAKIKHFCQQAKEIEDLKYLPITMR